MMLLFAIFRLKIEFLKILHYWDGNLETWQPPLGTIAKPVEEADINSLPPRPE